MMKLLLPLLFCFAHCCILQAQNAKTLMAQTIKTYEQDGGFSAVFEMQMKDPSQNTSETLEGTIEMVNDMFYINMQDTKIWFDGTVQWVYFSQNGEVNVTEPDENELAMTNPMFFLQNYSKGFTASFNGERTGPNGKTAYEIFLKPKMKIDIENIRLLLDKFENMPTTINVLLKNGITNRIVLRELERNISFASDAFVFPQANYPDVEVIDLR